MKFAITVDNVKKDNIPESAIGNGNKYYEVTATCDEGIKAEWDYNAWNLKVDNITKGTKCTLAFNSKLTETDYKNYIEAGVTYRRNTYRGKDITSKLKDGSLFKEIESGHFDDIYVGDYIISPSSKKDVNSQTVKWLIADLDNYLYTGNTEHELITHHATIIPAAPIATAQMNSTDSAEKGYNGSDMVKTTLPQVLNTYINPDFGTSNSSKDKKDHVITYENLLTLSANSELEEKAKPYLRLGGESAEWDFVQNRKLDLMSEVSVFGTKIAASNYLDPGLDTIQYAIFRLKPELIFTDGKGNRFSYWLKDIASASGFSVVDFRGTASVQNANVQYDVRPRFLIG